MEADSIRDAVAAARWVGCELSESQIFQLQQYHELLLSEYVAAGGVGPNETDRLWKRHIADSLLFGLALDGATTCVDVGSGVGLPGIPLAVAYPKVEIDLVDRSGRRCDLLRRSIAVLKLRNCHVVHSDVSDVDKYFDAVISRAALPPDELMLHVKRLLRPGGVGIIGLSWSGAAVPVSGDEHPELRLEGIVVPVDILDSPVNLLRIEAT